MRRRSDPGDTSKPSTNHQEKADAKLRSTYEPPTLISGLGETLMCEYSQVHWLRPANYRQFTPCSGDSPDKSSIYFEPTGVLDRVGEPLVVFEVNLASR
ncbi:hypothetical protein HAX54_042919, partial [Datura stramonium]|nr:hypothetical protein [Datura stramonium]